MAGAPAKRHMDKVAQLGCLICKRNYGPVNAYGPVELHHIAVGTGKRSDYAVAPLCEEHHRGGAGLHGMGVKKFCVLYRPPGDCEYGLLVWVNEDLARLK